MHVNTTWEKRTKAQNSTNFIINKINTNNCYSLGPYETYWFLTACGQNDYTNMNTFVAVLILTRTLDLVLALVTYWKL